MVGSAGAGSNGNGDFCVGRLSLDWGYAHNHAYRVSQSSDAGGWLFLRKLQWEPEEG